MGKPVLFGAALVLVAASVIIRAQQPGPVTPPNLRNSPPMPALPAVLDTAVQKIRVSAVATGLVNPWSLAFLPGPSTALGTSGPDMLITERPGRLRIVRGGVL